MFTIFIFAISPKNKTFSYSGVFDSFDEALFCFSDEVPNSHILSFYAVAHSGSGCSADDLI